MRVWDGSLHPLPPPKRGTAQAHLASLKPKGGREGDPPARAQPPACGASVVGTVAVTFLLPDPRPHAVCSSPDPLISRGHLINIELTNESVPLAWPREPLSAPEGLYLPLPSLCRWGN